MKNYVFYLLAIFGALLTSCDSNEIMNDDPTTDPTNVYIAGYRSDATYQDHAFVSKNGVDLTLNVSTSRSRAYSVFVQGNDVYVAGELIDDSFNSKAILWKNGEQIWTSSEFSLATDVEIVGADIYISGLTNDGVVYWKNGVKQILPNSVADVHTYNVKPRIEVSGSDVYVSGMNISGTYLRAAYWKNGEMFPLTGFNIISGATDIEVVGSDVYVSGTYFPSGEMNYGVYWKNGNEIAIAGCNEAVSIDIDNNNVYIAGKDKTLVDLGGGMTYYEVYAATWKNGTRTSYENASIAFDIDAVNNNTFIVGQTQFPRYLATWVNGVEDFGTQTETNAMSVFAN